MKIVKSVVNTYLLSHMLWNAKHRLCKHVDTSKDIEKKRKQKTHATHVFLWLIYVDMMNKTNSRQKKDMLQIWVSGGERVILTSCQRFPSDRGHRCEMSQMQQFPQPLMAACRNFFNSACTRSLALYFWKKKSRKTQGEKMYRCCLVHNAKYCKCCQISKLSPALNSPLPSVFSRPCISLISHLIQISFDLLHQIIISLLYPPSFRMLPGPLLFHHPHLHPLSLLPRPSSGCFGYMVKGC